MIIKSISRKTASFRALIEYFHKEKTADSDCYTHNLICSDPDGAATEMEENAKFLPRRLNGNVVYHEIISLPENAKIAIPRQASMLEVLVQQYVKRRCPNNLVYGKLHRDQRYLHYHLAISSNGVKERSRHWLAKSDLARIQREVEDYKIQHFPELGQQKYYDPAARDRKRQREENTPHLTDHEQAFKRRTGEPSRKEQDHATLRLIFDQALSEADLTAALSQAGFQLYRRGETEGVIAHDGRKYRLKTLGLETALQTTKLRIAVYAERQQELADLNRPIPDQNRERS